MMQPGNPPRRRGRARYTTGRHVASDHSIKHWRRPSWRWVAGFAGVVALIVLWAILAQSAWGRHQEDVLQMRQAIGVATDALLSGEAWTVEQVQQYSSKLEQASTMCRANVLAAGYPLVASGASDQAAQCQEVAGQYRELYESLHPVADGWIMSQQVAEIIQTADSGERDDLRQQSQRWRDAAGQLQHIETTDEYRALLNEAQQTATRVASAYEALAQAATATQ